MKNNASLGSLLFVAACAGTASAHFPWLATNEAGHAVLWFGENLDDRAYQLPDALRDIEIRSAGATTRMEQVDSDSFIGLRSVEPINGLNELAAEVTYGLYHGNKLTYHVEHLPQRDRRSWPTEQRDRADFQTIITADEDAGIRVKVIYQSKPLSGTEVKLFGRERGAANTNDEGVVRFKSQDLSPGLNGLLIGITKKETGNYQGKAYSGEAIYLTSTFRIESSDEAMTTANATPRVDPSSTAKIEPAIYPDLPEELTSFGAAVAGGKLYIYGGHTGTAHSYSVEEQSDRFWSLDLTDGADASWIQLAGGPRLQGLAMVADGEDVIRIGGFTAMNAADEEHNLRSQSLVARYTAADKSWSELPAIPEPRSSLDAAVLDGTLYVVGGWDLNGDFESTWHTTAWSLDLSNPAAGWQEIAEPPFRRRALSVASLDGKLYVIGGMEAGNKTTTRVDIYDPRANSWSLGPPIPGSGMSGFGTAAFATGGGLYVSAMDGFVHELSGACEAWRTIAQLDPSRFFHRMLPIAADRLIIVGGANMDIGKFTDLEMVRLR